MFTDDSLDEGGAQLCPCGIATATPQHFTVVSHTDIHMPAQKFPAEPKPDRPPRSHVIAKHELFGVWLEIQLSGQIGNPVRTNMVSQ